MFGDKWKAIRGGAGVEAAPTPHGRAARGAGSAAGSEKTYARPSHGLEQFLAAISDFQGFPLLDLAGASQANITVLTELGYRLYSDNVVRNLEAAFGKGPDFLENQSDPERVRQFMDASLDFPANHFCGALIWDTLQFLAQPLLQDTVDQLYDILLPGSSMFALFHANERSATVPVFSYRIADAKSILLSTQNGSRPAHFLNNRAVENLFRKFHSVKFFLTRDNLREVIVRR